MYVCWLDPNFSFHLTFQPAIAKDNFGSTSIANLVDPAGASAAGMGPDSTARRLFLGGGPEVFMTNCVVDVLQALTALGLIGTTLDTIVNVP